MMKITKRAGHVELIYEADTVEEMKLLIEHKDPRKPLNRCLSCGLEFDGDGQSGCPNAYNHIDERSYEMNVQSTKCELSEIIRTSTTDTEFERRITQFCEDTVEDCAGNPLEDYGTVDRLRELLDKYGVEAEDILVAYRKEIEAEEKGKTKR